MLQTDSLSFSYTNGPSFSFPNLNLAAQEVLVVLGNSGNGKTTLLHLLAGLMEPRSGSVRINGQSITDLSGKNRDRFRASQS